MQVRFTSIAFLSRAKLATPALATLLLFAGPAAAQDMSSTTDSATELGTARPDSGCMFGLSEPGSGTRKMLIASCAGQGVLLGEVDSYEIIPNSRLRATLVDSRFRGIRQIRMISLSADGVPVVEDLTGQIAYQVGRGATGSIESLTLDLSAFTANGGIGLEDGNPSDGQRRNAGARIDLTPQIERAKQLQIGRPGMSVEGGQ